MEDLLSNWLADIARGDRVAFSRLYERTAPHLFAQALRILKRSDLAEEVLQECFLKIWKQAGDFDVERGTAMAWIATMLRNRCLDILRRMPREPVAMAVASENFFSDVGVDPLAYLEEKREAGALQRCLDLLSQDERRAVVTAFWSGLTHRELAERFQSPLGTVKSWVRRGLERLKGCLES